MNKRLNIKFNYIDIINKFIYKSFSGFFHDVFFNPNNILNNIRLNYIDFYINDLNKRLYKLFIFISKDLNYKYIEDLNEYILIKEIIPYKYSNVNFIKNNHFLYKYYFYSNETNK